MLNNASDQMVMNLQDSGYGGKRCGTERPKDASFANIAKEMGFAFAKRVAEKEQVAPAISELLKAQGPAFLEVLTDHEEILYPKVAPGKSYQEMELGPYIREVKG